MSTNSRVPSVPLAKPQWVAVDGLDPSIHLQPDEERGIEGEAHDQEPGERAFPGNVVTIAAGHVGFGGSVGDIQAIRNVTFNVLQFMAAVTFH